ncbi:MAG: tyrosine-type recombinase/integrase [Methylocystis sp.]
MTREKLTAAKAKGALAPGRYLDGAGLYLQVKPSGARSWIFRYKVAGKPKFMGLGPFPAVSLAKAREKASEARRMRAEGSDPIRQKRRADAQAARETAAAITFEKAALECIASKQGEWRSPKTAYIWNHTLKTYAFPAMGALPIGDIELQHVKEALEPVRMAKPETGRRLRRQIEAVLTYAKAHGWRTGDNPAAERLVDAVMAKPSNGVAHRPAMRWQDVPAFMARLDDLKDLSAIALRVVILTACRTSEALGARWNEIDLKAKVWTVPKSRMKAGKEHKVPLSREAVAALKTAARFRLANSDYVFPGARLGQPLSNMALLTLLRRMQVTGVTVHGFRSSFRDWAAETTDFPPEICEAALAHHVGNAVERAYRRTSFFDRRRDLMDAWGAHCDSETV